MAAFLKSNIKLLLVEDNPGDARLFTEMMKSANCNIDNVGSLSEAIKSAGEMEYDLVLLDLGLPDSKGLDTFKKFISEDPQTPVIVLTGNDDDELGTNLVKLGAQDFLVKGKFDDYILQKSISYSIDRFKTKKAIETKEAKFRQLIAKNADGMIVLDEHDKVVYLNEAAESLIGRKSHDIIGEEFKVIEANDDFTELNIYTPEQKYKTLQLNLYDSIWEDKPVKVASLRNITELRLNQERVEHLNQLLKTIGAINHLIVNEKNAEQLLSKAAELMTVRNYKTAWIGLINEENKLTDIFQSGFKKDLKNHREIFSDCHRLKCIKQTQESESIVVSIDTDSICAECPLETADEREGILAIKIAHEDKYYGLMVVSRSSFLMNIDEEEKLLAEIASDLGLALHTFDIEKRKKAAEEKLVESERFAKSTLDSISKNIAVINDDGEIIAVNKSWNDFAEENDGNKSAVSVGANYLDVCKQSAEKGDEIAGEVYEKITNIIQDKENSFSLEYPCHSPNEKRWFNLSVTRFKDEGPVRLVVSHDNITQLKLTTMKVIENEKRFRSLFNASPDIIAIQNFDREIIECNRIAEKVLGYSREDLLELTVQDIQKHYTDEELQLLTKILHQKDSIVFESTLLTKQGKEIPVEVNASVIDYLNKPAVLTISRDITERKEAQKAEEKNLQIARALYDMSKMVDLSEDRIMQNALELGVKFTESEGGYLHFLNNDKVSLNLFKWSESVHKICEAEKIEHYPLDEAGIWADCIRKGEPVIHNYYQKELERKGLPEGHFPVKRHMSVPIFEGDEIVAVAGVGNKEKEYTKNDSMTLSLFMNEMWKLIHRKQVAEQIKVSEERYRSLYENATIGIYRSTMDGKVMLANPAFLKMLGFNSLSEIQKVSVEQLYFDKEQFNEFRELIKNEGTVYGYESKLKKADGEIITMRESAKLVESGIEGDVIEGVVEDVTVEKQIREELILARDKAQISDKLKSEFLAQMSHEIRTPLNAMLSGIDFVEDETKDLISEEVAEIYSTINSSGNRIINTIQKILNMSELQAGSYEVVRSEFDFVKEIISPTISLYNKEIAQKNLKVDLKVTDETVVMTADRYSMNEIFTNIFDNAVKYTNKGSIEVEITKNEGKIGLRVKDTGIGISNEYLENIFDPFSQESQGYSRPYDGVGLGLALTKKYCEINGGEISITSTREVGTEVKVILPCGN